MNFLVWRHADAAPGEPDELRPLTPLGIQQAQYIGAWIKKMSQDLTAYLEARP